MQVTLLPFFSKQCKQSASFMLSEDSGVRMLAYMASRFLAEGHRPVLVLPELLQCKSAYTPPCEVLRAGWLPMDNLVRRVHWPAPLLSRIAQLGGSVITLHETAAVPLRVLNSRLKLFTECGMRLSTVWPQTDELIKLAWCSSDMVHCCSEQLRKQVDAAETSVWQFAYPDKLAEPRSCVRDIDVLFNSRCSSTGYTHHQDFQAAMRGSSMRWAVLDSTQYLGAHTVPDRDEYESILHRSRAAVCLIRSGQVPIAFKEAVAAGAVPVCVPEPEYVDVLGASWPYYCTDYTVRLVAERAAEAGWPDGTREAVMGRIRPSSFSEAWKLAYSDWRRVCGT
jgi:hypothetical protein